MNSAATSSQQQQQQQQPNQDPAEVLEALRAELDEKLKNLAQTNQQATELKADAERRKKDIDALEPLVNEIEKALKEYENAHPQLSRDKKESDDYLQGKETMLKAAIGVAAAEIDRILYEVDADIDALWKRISEFTDAYEIASTKHADASKVLSEKEDAFTALIAYQKSVGEGLKARNLRRKNIEAKEDEGKLRLAYFLVRDKNDFTIDSPAKLKRDLPAAWNAVEDAREALRYALAELDNATLELDAAKAKFKAAHNNRDANIVEQISQIP